VAGQKIREVMTANPETVETTDTIRDAAKRMREKDIGAVIVMNKDRVGGVLTDRDITVRAVAEGRDPDQVRVKDICSADIMTLSPDDSIDRAIEVMRNKAVRRIPVVEGGKPVGMVSIGDLAMERDERSALASISAAPPNT